MVRNLKEIGVILWDFLEIVLISAAVFAIMYFFVGQLLLITGDSMFPTFKNDEQILSEKISLKFKEPKKGEVMVIEHSGEPGRLLIKRLIAGPGDTFLITGGKVYVNDIPIDEPYLNEQNSTHGGTVILENNKYLVPQGEYIFLGDNREKSSDSRDFNTIRLDEIKGRPILVYYPISAFRIVRN